MRTPDPQAAPAANVMPLSLPYPSMAVYVGMFGKAFEIMHELTLEAMMLTRRGTELWLERRELHHADLAPLTPWDAFAAIGSATAGADGKMHEAPSPSEDKRHRGCAQGR